MKRILFATDFSENAENAFRYALALFENDHCIYTLLHVIPYIFPSDDLYDYGNSINSKEAESSFKIMLDKFKKDISSKNITIESRIEIGDVDELLADFADKNKMDLIVMGTKGASGLREIFIGSTTLSVVKSTHCPVLVIPEKSTYRSPKKIVFAVDFRRKIEEASIQPLIHIAKKYNSEILLLQVKGEEEETLDEAVSGLRLNNNLEGIPHSYHIIHDNDIPHGIERFVHENKSEFIILISKHHDLFERLFQESVTEKLVLHSTLPLLVLEDYGE